MTKFFMFLALGLVFVEMSLMLIEYVGKFFGKGFSKDKVQRNANTMLVALLSETILMLSIFVIPPAVSAAVMILQVAGCAAGIAALGMHAFYVEL